MIIFNREHINICPSTVNQHYILYPTCSFINMSTLYQQYIYTIWELKKNKRLYMRVYWSVYHCISSLAAEHFVTSFLAVYWYYSLGTRPFAFESGLWWMDGFLWIVHVFFCFLHVNRRYRSFLLDPDLRRMKLALSIHSTDIIWYVYPNQNNSMTVLGGSNSFFF